MARSKTSIYRIAYERTMEPQGRPWRIETSSGDCLYTGRVEMRVHSWTVLEPGPVRFSGYLECVGVLEYSPERSIIREQEQDNA
ncbi:MAG: hypothetical protein Q7R40_14210 [Phaeospirillum sp.]|nr:hypothetical protein [Phaeospirillum sp.]